MTLIEILVQFYGRACEVAGTPDAVNQCADWANKYIRDVLNLSIIEWTDAKDFPSKAGDKYDYIKSTPTNYPLLGDIVVWTGNIGSGHGHIAIALGGDANTFVSTDENWSISQRVTVERHNYNNVDGWLHPKQLIPMITIPAKERDDLIAISSKYDELKVSFEKQKQLTVQVLAKAEELQRQLDAIVVHEPPQVIVDPQEALQAVEDFKVKIRPLVNGGWLVYLRSRANLQKLCQKLQP